MTENEWDEDLKKKIEGLLQRLGVGFYPESMIWKFIQTDREHQQAEMLKRLNVDRIIYTISNTKYQGKFIGWLPSREEIAEAIHKLIKEKLK